MPRFTAQFRTEPGLSDEARGGLHAAGIQLLGGYGNVSHGEPGGQLPEPGTHVVWVDAEDEAEAGRKVTDAVKGKTVAFELLSVEPEGG